MSHDWRKLSRGTVALVTMTAMTGCGGVVRKGPRPSGNEVVSAPPRAYYDQLFSARLALMDDASTTATANQAGTTAVGGGQATAGTTSGGTTGTGTDQSATNATPKVDQGSGMPAPLPPVTSAPAPMPPVTSGPTSVPPIAALPQETLWLNFAGATIERGFDKGQSFLVCSDKATIGAPTAIAAANQDTIVSMVQQYYSAAGANLKVTATMPATGEYTTVIVGGSLSDLVNVLTLEPTRTDPWFWQLPRV